MAMNVSYETTDPRIAELRRRSAAGRKARRVLKAMRNKTKRQAALEAPSQPAEPSRLFHFVRIHDVGAWLRLGWHDTGPLPGVHGEWSHGLEWLCACAPVYPRRQ